ncbi:Forkhead-associated (FHA) domain-containing protein [Cynara cardunculus var. scolymus]|uniref:Forkhead-associated (FHA) domain-containing protein n=1 Tax=Cynara cardunculus var. scolymus TaxID=59895 RepID=A0A103XY55_CYNCS|nr:Forkhead-associated (FHA) domain-containing protein [Cynara cardunculus var. scolymus]
MKNSDYSLQNPIKRLRSDGNLCNSSVSPIKKPKPTISSTASIHIKAFCTPLISKSTGSSVDLIHLQPCKPCTIGRDPRRCDYTFEDRQVSKEHCQIYFDVYRKKVFVVDGVLFLRSGEGSRVRASLNGVFVDGIRVGNGEIKEVGAGSEVSVVCGDESVCSVGGRIGFSVERIVFMEEVIDRNLSNSKQDYLFPYNVTGELGSGKLANAGLLSSECKQILSSDDPVLYIRECFTNPCKLRAKYVSRNRVKGNSCFTPDNFLSHSPCVGRELHSCEGLAINNSSNSNNNNTNFLSYVPLLDLDTSFRPNCIASESNAELLHCRVNGGHLQESVKTSDPLGGGISIDKRENYICEEKIIQASQLLKPKKRGVCVPPPGNKFYLNRLHFMDDGQSDEVNVTLPELLYPVETLERVFIATFTSDLSWFLSYCEIPPHLPVSIACHNAERCWDPSPDKRTLNPSSDFPNLVVIYPQFPEVISFSKDRKKFGIACHHPKLFVLQRDDSIRVIITSANLVAKQINTFFCHLLSLFSISLKTPVLLNTYLLIMQWLGVTNTVWWQDFPHRNVPDYTSLFAQSSAEEVNLDLKSDFAAQLAGFMATLLVDAPNQAHWILELAKFDFSNAAGHLVASVPGIYSPQHPYISKSLHYLTGDCCMPRSLGCMLLGSVEASVVGINHLFRTSRDSNGSLIKKLAGVLGNCRVNAYGMSEVILRRNVNIAADANAVGVAISRSEEFPEGGCIQLGFLPRDVAKWVAPLSDVGWFAFSAYINPNEVLACALEGSNNKVHLILYGPKFLNISKLSPPVLASAMCSLILGHYKWPEHCETDFTFGSSSVGSINAPFLAAFSAATGKRSMMFSESEESDPDWGCWSASQELRNPSIRIIFPTIERVKTASSGILASKYILCFTQKTWLRLKHMGILHDAVPRPLDRVGHPMHVKPNEDARSKSVLGSRLHICNYEFGIVFVVPPSERKDEKHLNLDNISLPFVVPAPRYRANDTPATKLAMKEALIEVGEKEIAKTVDFEEEIADEEEEEVLEVGNLIVEEKEEEKTYAEKLWVSS